MSWSATAPDFDVHLFMDHARATKPPYYCPFPECQRKLYRSFSGMQTHLTRHHPKAMAAPRGSAGGDRGDGGADGGGGDGEGLGRGLPWGREQTVMEVDCGGTLWRLNITESLSVQRRRDSEVTEEVGSAAVEAEYRAMLRVAPETVPRAEWRELAEWGPPESPTSPLPGKEYLKYSGRSAAELEGEVEYDMDEEDLAWLGALNRGRGRKGRVEEAVVEQLMDRLEKESHWETTRSVVDEDAVCCVCQDGECQNANVILFCDMCNLAVHQECYGIPYVPEGQWLCRRCQLSPSMAVGCSLCPNKGGAFKQTAEGKWVHVICAIWVPEVHFANTVFLEPVEGLDSVPAARWKLKCIVCKQRGVGACIQCNKPSCYTPFHVTCAQSAGVYMKVEPVSATSPGGTPFAVRKFIYCDIHAPSPASPSREPGVSMSRSLADAVGRTPGAEELAARRHLSLQKMRKARKLLAQSRNTAPTIAVPAIPLKTLEDIASLIPVDGAEELIAKVFAYWRLKRESRFGVPLLRRLQCQKSKLVSSGGGGMSGGRESGASGEGGSELSEEDRRELRRTLRVWRGLRQDLERVRLLCELLRKREKLKVEHIGLAEELVERLWRPTGRAYVDAIEKIMEKDRFKVFASAVSEEDVPGYRTIVSHPMDLSTMHAKAQKGAYKSWSDLYDDFRLMIDNCTTFNRNNATFYKYGLRMKRLGMQVLKQAREWSAGAAAGGKEKEAALASLQTITISFPALPGSSSAHLPPLASPPPPLSPPSAPKTATKTDAKTVVKTDAKTGTKRSRSSAAPSSPQPAPPPAKRAKKQSSIKDFVKRGSRKGKEEEEAGAGPSTRSAFKDYRSVDPRSPALSSAASSEEVEGGGWDSEAGGGGSQSPSQAEEEEEGSEYGYLLEHPRPLDMVWAPLVLPGSGGRRGVRAWMPAVVLDPATPTEGITVEGIALEPPPAAVKARDPNTDITDEHEIRVLVRFFDANLTWDWVAFIELFHFVGDPRIDNGRLQDAKRAADRAVVQHAFDRAKLFWYRQTNISSLPSCLLCFLLQVQNEQEAGAGGSYPAPVSRKEITLHRIMNSYPGILTS